MFPTVTFSNAAFTVPAGSTHVGQVGIMSAARIVTLPAANTLANGQVLIVKDESGTATGTFTITVNRAGSDTINGGTTGLVIDGSNGSYVRLVSNGSNAWTGSASLPVVPRTTASVTPAKTGTAVLVAGTVTVADTSVTVNSVIRCTNKTAGGTVGVPFVSARSAGTSFTITSTSGTDTSTVQYDVVSY